MLWRVETMTIDRVTTDLTRLLRARCAIRRRDDSEQCGALEIPRRYPGEIESGGAGCENTHDLSRHKGRVHHVRSLGATPTATRHTHTAHRHLYIAVKFVKYI